MYFYQGIRNSQSFALSSATIATLAKPSASGFYNLLSNFLKVLGLEKHLGFIGLLKRAQTDLQRKLRTKDGFAEERWFGPPFKNIPIHIKIAAGGLNVAGFKNLPEPVDPVRAREAAGDQGGPEAPGGVHRST